MIVELRLLRAQAEPPQPTSSTVPPSAAARARRNARGDVRERAPRQDRRAARAGRGRWRRPRASRIQPMASERQIHVGPVAIGGGAPVAVQTMTKTETANLQATMDQIRDGRRGRRGHRARRRAARAGRRGAEDDRRAVADPDHRRHPLQPHARAEGDRSRRALRAAEPRQHRRPGEGRRGDRAGEAARHAAARRRQLRLAAQAPAPARVRQPRRGARHRRARDRRS